MAIQILGHDSEPQIREVNINKESIFIHIHDWVPRIEDAVGLLVGKGLREPNINIQAQVQRVIKPNQWYQGQGVVLVFLKVESRRSKAFEQLLNDIFEGRGIGCRKKPRATLTIDVELSIDGVRKKAVLENISKAGACLKLVEPGAVENKAVGLTLIHPGTKRKFILKGYVVRVEKVENNGCCLGIQFLEQPPIREKDLDLFLRSLIFTKQRKKKTT